MSREYIKRTLISKDEIRKFLDKIETGEDEELELLGKKLLQSYNKLFAIKNVLSSDNKRLLPYEEMYHKEKTKNENLEKKVNKTIYKNKSLVTENAELKIKIDEFLNLEKNFKNIANKF